MPLLKARSPVDVAGFVMTIVVDAVNSQVWGGAWSEFFVKLLE
jgi:hypothetical protein